MNTQLSLLGRNIKLNRYPIRHKETLQAWDAADELLITYLSEQTIKMDTQLLIIGDHFGALSSWFAPLCHITMVSDSFISHRATQQNLEQNALPSIQIHDALLPLPMTDICIMRLPKSKRLLIWHLIQLCQTMPEGTTIITAAKAKDIHTSTLKLFEKHLGKTHTSLAKKKARLIFTQVDKSKLQNLPEPVRWKIPEHQMTLTNHANVFSGESLDLGARFMLEHIPQDSELTHIIDLGCGNGVLGIKAARLNPHARVTCVDESFMAVTSTQDNAAINLGQDHKLKAIANNALENFPKETADLILCNPPFHQQNTVTDHIAMQMFKDAHKMLRKNGKLRVIGNQHLKYQHKLKRLFGAYTVVATNKKFIIIEVTK